MSSTQYLQHPPHITATTYQEANLTRHSVKPQLWALEKKVKIWAGQMAVIKAPAALTEDPCFVPSTYMVAHN